MSRSVNVGEFWKLEMTRKQSPQKGRQLGVPSYAGPTGLDSYCVVTEESG